MKKLFSFGLLLLVFTITFSCEKDEDPSKGKLVFKVNLTNGQTVVGQNQVVSLSNVKDLNISLFRLYFSSISLQNATNEIVIKDVALLDPGVEGENSFTVELEDASFTNINFGLGLNAVQNAKNPGDFANDDPLSTYQSMYWSMLKYRFAKFEGKANETGKLGSGNDVSIAYHPGTDSIFQQLSLPINITVKEETTKTININIDLETMFVTFDPIDLLDETQTQTHSTPADIHVAKKFMENLKASIWVN